MIKDSLTKLTSIDLFAGAGGLALGIHQAGFSSLGLVEFNRQACATLRINADSLSIATRWPVIEGDARLIDYSTLGRDIDLLAGGAPCQPFSLGGKHRGDEDGRNMFPEVFRAARALRPKAILLENVRGLTRHSFRPYFNYILAQLSHPHIPPLGRESWMDHHSRLERIRRSSGVVSGDEYDVHWKLINGANHGVPQKRERVIIVALRRDLEISWKFPLPTHNEDRLLFEQSVTGEYWEKRNLQARSLDPRLGNRIHGLRLIPPPELPWRTLHDAVIGLPEPVNGIDSEGWTFHAGIPGGRVYKGHTGNDLHKPAKTIKAGDHGNPGGEHIMLKDDGSIRYMTVRECARVQTFPDEYRFSGSRTEAMRQIGNAVPVALARRLAESIHDVLALETGTEYSQLDIIAVASD